MNLKAIFLALTLVAISSCTIIPEIFLFNNANEPATISVGGEEISINPGKSRKIGWYPVKSFEIRLGGTEYSYTVEHWPMEYAYFTGWWIFVDRKIEAQLNADGSIFVLTENQTAPVPAEIFQPTGFPLTPDSP